VAVRTAELAFDVSSSSVPPPWAESGRPYGSEAGQPESSSSSSSVMTPMDVRAFKTLEIMKSCHDFDSTMSVESLVAIRERYSIPSKYALHAPLPGQHLYNTHPDGFSIFVDALEAGLRFPLHPGDYYLIARIGFRVGAAPSNNKGWKTQYLFISCRRRWGFYLEWSAHPMSNVPLYLTDEESALVGRLKRILSTSQVTRDMIELWLVEASLSPTSRGMLYTLFPYLHLNA
ncbi:hypothetical protein BHE74_00004471, partial [Ensete ventricosum]